MSLIITALSPIFGLIFIGYGLKYIKFANENFWITLDKLTYYGFFPALLFYKLATANFDDGFSAIVMVKVVLISVLVVSVFLSIIQFFIKFKPSSYTSIYQGAVRYNTFVYLGLVDSLYGDMGMVLTIFLITFLIPILNFLCVSVFGFYINEDGFSLKRFIHSIIKNPLILACVAGGVLNVSGVELIFGDLIKLLGTPAIPLGLLSVGVGLKIKELGTFKLDFWLSSFAKLLFLPILVIIFANIFTLNELMYNITLLFAAMPTAVSSYILARELGGDLSLMSTLITGQTILSFFTLSLLLLYIN